MNGKFAKLQKENTPKETSKTPATTFCLINPQTLLWTTAAIPSSENQISVLQQQQRKV